MERLQLLQRHGIPLYIQVSGLLRKRLEAGEWRLGEQIPTIDVLMGEYGVSRITMRQALAELEKQGLVRRGQGRGTFVTRDASKERWLIMPSEWHALVEHVEVMNARVVELTHDDRAPALDDASGMPATAYWHARRINFADETPYSVTDLYVARDVYNRNARTYSARPVLPLLARTERRSIGTARQILAVGTADVEVARHLGLAVGAPIAEVRRFVLDRKGRVIYLADVSYPARYLRVETTLLGGDEKKLRRSK
jgi:GntR family transcriptional regulator